MRSEQKFKLAAALVIAVIAAPVRGDLVESWGVNDSGQLGDGTTTNRTSPVPVTSLTTGVTAVAAGLAQSFAIQNGAVFGWGDSVGDGTTTQHLTPVAIGLTSGVTAVASGMHSTLAIQNGAAYAWGYNGNGELGDGTKTTRQSPVTVSNLSSGVTAIAVGGSYGPTDGTFSLAIQNGGVYAWGSNGGGELGNGTTTNKPTPGEITSLSTNVTVIAAGGGMTQNASGGTIDGSFALAIQNGGVYGWGYNADGQLGDGTKTNRSTPVAVTALSSGVTSLATGETFGLAVKGGNVYSWGFGGENELGYAQSLQLTPQIVDPTDLTDIIAVAAGRNSSYALAADGSIWVWGWNYYGELGLGTTMSNYATPQQLLPPAGYKFTSIAAPVSWYDAIATVAAVPEPAGISMLAVGAAAMLRRRRVMGN